MMDKLVGMKTFVAVVDAGSFTAAADRVGITNKLVSKYVAQLEDHLGIRLLHRTTRTLSLTDAGQRYYARCAELLDDVDRLESSLLEKETGLSGTLRIAAPTTFGEIYIAPLLYQFQKQHPDLTVDLRLNDRYVDLAEEGFDLSIRIGDLGDSGMIAKKLTTVELWAIAAPEYLEAHGTPETPTELKTHALLLDTNIRTGNVWQFNMNGQMQRISVKGNMMVNSAKTIADLVVSGAGIALSPNFCAAPLVKEGLVNRILLDNTSASLDINAVFLNTRYMPAKVRGVLDYLSGRFKQVEGWAELAEQLK